MPRDLEGLLLDLRAYFDQRADFENMVVDGKPAPNEEAKFLSWIDDALDAMGSTRLI